MILQELNLNENMCMSRGSETSPDLICAALVMQPVPHNVTGIPQIHTAAVRTKTKNTS